MHKRRTDKRNVMYNSLLKKPFQNLCSNDLYFKFQVINGGAIGAAKIAGPAVNLKILVPAVASGAIIGKGGETIADIQKQTGTKIKMSKANDFYPGTTERVGLLQGRIILIELFPSFQACIPIKTEKLFRKQRGMNCILKLAYFVISKKSTASDKVMNAGPHQVLWNLCFFLVMHVNSAHFTIILVFF